MRRPRSSSRVSRCARGRRRRIEVRVGKTLRGMAADQLPGAGLLAGLRIVLPTRRAISTLAHARPRGNGRRAPAPDFARDVRQGAARRCRRRGRRWGALWGADLRQLAPTPPPGDAYCDSSRPHLRRPRATLEVAPVEAPYAGTLYDQPLLQGLGSSFAAGESRRGWRGRPSCSHGAAVRGTEQPRAISATSAPCPASCCLMTSILGEAEASI